MNAFDNVKKNFGFGCMRLPMNGKEVDLDEFNAMVDLFMESGFNYFDTARVYIEEQSETAIRECISKRYPRESFILTDKLSGSLFKTEEEIRPLFNKQLESCGVDYFDFYLMHAQTASLYETYKKCRAYEQAFELKKEGKIRHVGISFHDKAAVLEKILTEYPDIEVVQLQLNYLDYDDPAVEARKCSEVCNKFDKPIIVMEPVKGGNLADLPEKAAKIIENLNGGTAASYAIRFAAGVKGVAMVLSGMSDLKQMQDNVSFMKDFKPLDDTETKAVKGVVDVFNSLRLIPCTACRYCIDGCPKHISIPDLFSCLNSMELHRDWNASYYYGEVCTKDSGKASDCIECGKCEKACPQHFEIRKLLKKVADEFEKESK